MNWYKVWQDNHIFNVEKNLLKKKRFIFTPYLRVNQDGFVNGNFREYLFADSLARYLRYRGENVLYAPGFDTLSYSFFMETKIERNALDTHLFDKYYNELLAFNVGFAANKVVNCLDRESLLFIQKFFLYLYKQKVIRYEEKEVLEDIYRKKIYDSIESRYKDRINKRKVFTLDLKRVLPRLVENINKLTIPLPVKEELLCKLELKQQLLLTLFTKTNHEFVINLEKPEILGSLQAIVLNPSLIDILDFVAPEEIFAVENFLETGSIDYLYSGNTSINPLTGEEVPIFISNHFSVAIKPLFSYLDEDLKIIEKLEIEPLSIVADNLLINSDFLDGLSLAAAREKITQVFVEEGLARIDEIYSKREILISSLDVLGCPFPLMEGPNDMLLLDEHLPLTFSNKFRIVVPNEGEILSDYQLIEGSMNSLFCSGIYPLMSILLEKNMEIENINAYSNLEELRMWLKNSIFLVNKNNLVYELFMPVLMISLIETLEDVSLDLPTEIVFFDNVYDEYGNEIKKDFNNCLRIQEMLEVYSADAIRLYYLDNKMINKFYYAKEKLFAYKQILLNVKSIYSQGFVANNLDLEFNFYQFKNKIYECLVSYDFGDYISSLKDYLKSLNGQRMTKKIALEFLVIFSVVCPELAEDLHYTYFSTKQLIFDSEWPL